MFYLAKTPSWLKKLYAKRLWQMPGNQKVIYLTFDDGPDPGITPFVLDELGKFNAKATFFCIGKNVDACPTLYQRILSEGHATGNHTYDHLNGWKTKNEVYLDNIIKANNCIDSSLFRPPYGRMTRQQEKMLQDMPHRYHTVMWSVLSADFDTGITPQKCCKNVIENTGNGDVVVFHDSQKAFIRLRYALPAVLEHFSERGFLFEKITVK